MLSYSLASKVKMGKKLEKSLKNEKNPSATSQDETDSNKALGKKLSFNPLFNKFL